MSMSSQEKNKLLEHLQMPLSLIRFPLMSQQELARLVVPLGLVADAVLVPVFRYLSARNMPAAKSLPAKSGRATKRANGSARSPESRSGLYGIAAWASREDRKTPQNLGKWHLEEMHKDSSVSIGPLGEEDTGENGVDDLDLQGLQLDDLSPGMIQQLKLQTQPRGR
eukprot:gb/GEZN01018471.1/.p1 GENE.gb/GEZN01018471.1/~~gb/GEZN01018471.1/.p1  ORF type:complete len:184 (-),score=25.31 gb/GEZN01018471.1/:202-702(-)